MQAIAVIDDEATFCEVIKEALENAKITVRCAVTGALGAEMLQQQRFDLALIDVELPDASGVALAEIAVNENTPVVFMSGNLNVIDGLSDWGVPHLEKPFRLAALHTEIARVMDDSQNQLQRVRETFSRIRAMIDGLENVWNTSKRLIDTSRSLVDRAATSGPISSHIGRYDGPSDSFEA
jgi:DNA-binding response OmpR family regulator